MLENILVIGLLFHLAEDLAEGAYICSVVCEDGQYCSQDKCMPCPQGTFQEELVHQMTKCIPYTTKPSDSNFVIARNGTSVSDVVWKCRDGYYQYSINECVKNLITFLQSSTAKSTTQTTMPLNVTTTTVEPYQQTSNENKVPIVAIIVPSVVLCLLFIAISGIIYWRFCYKQNFDESSRFESWKQQNCDSVDDKEALLSNSNNKLPKDINFGFFYRIVNKLGVHLAERFLRVLDDPSGTFHVDNVISFEREKHSEPEYYLTVTCLDWAYKNINITNHREHVQKALTVIGRHNLLRTIEEAEQFAKENLKGITEITNNHSKNNSLTIVSRREESSADRITLFSYLLNQLGSQDALTLLYQLPNDDKQFNARNFFEQKMNFEHASFVLAFVETLEEWHLRNSDSVLMDCITTILKDNSRYDVLNDEEFVNLLQKQCTSPKPLNHIVLEVQIVK